jgi:hypothetical protein
MKMLLRKDDRVQSTRNNCGGSSHTQPESTVQEFTSSNDSRTVTPKDPSSDSHFIFILNEEKAM